MSMCAPHSCHVPAAALHQEMSLAMGHVCKQKSSAGQLKSLHFTSSEMNMVTVRKAPPCFNALPGL